MHTRTSHTKPQRAEGITACRWASYDEASQLVSYANARDVLHRANEMVQGGNHDAGAVDGRGAGDAGGAALDRRSARDAGGAAVDHRGATGADGAQHAKGRSGK